MCIRDRCVSIPKWIVDRDALRVKIEETIHSEYPSCVLDWSDQRSLHLKVSECFQMNSDVYITGKKSKKLHKLYYDYQKVCEKIAKSGYVVESESSHAAEQPEEPVEQEQAEEEQAEEDVLESWEDFV